MVRERPVVNRTRWLALLLLVLAADQPALAQTAAPAPPSAASAAEPIDRQPYRIRVVFLDEPDARLDSRARSALLDDWQTLVRRFVGGPWKVEILSPELSGELDLGRDLETLSADGFDKLAEGFDKVWIIRATGPGPGLNLLGREYDAATRRLGPLQKREAPVARDASRALFLFTLELFSPFAVIGERFAKDVSLTVRAASIPPASPIGRVVTAGSIFQPLRIVPRKNAAPLAREITSTFLRVEAAEGAGARCSYVSLYSNPLTDRVVQKNTTLVALGLKPGKSTTRLRFLTLPDRAPAAGYVLTVRSLPDGLTRDIATTDRGGRVALPPGFADGLVMLRLIAGNEEPMLEFPLMPGTDTAERTLPAFDPKPLTVALEARLDSIRDTIVDLVATRARLEARLKARLEGEDWAGMDDTLKEFRDLPPRDRLADQVTTLKDEATRQQAESKRPVLTKTAQARLSDVQNLIERYLDDEAFTAYSDALKQATSQAAAERGKAKGKAVAKGKANAGATEKAQPKPGPGPPG